MNNIQRLLNTSALFLIKNHNWGLSFSLDENPNDNRLLSVWLPFICKILPNYFDHYLLNVTKIFWNFISSIKILFFVTILTIILLSGHKLEAWRSDSTFLHRKWRWCSLITTICLATEWYSHVRPKLRVNDTIKIPKTMYPFI